jgi:hypothetical protein
MGSKRKKRKKRSGSSRGRRKGGVMMGMRSGFKNVAHSVTGVGEEAATKKKTGVVGTAITVLLVLAAAALLYQRFG